MIYAQQAPKCSMGSGILGVIADAGCQRVENQHVIQGQGIYFRVAMRPGKRRGTPHAPEGRVDDMAEVGKAHILAKVGRHFG